VIVGTPENVIETRHLTKTYRIGVGRARVREMLPPPIDKGVAKLLPTWWYKDTFDALHDLTLEIPKGSSIGVVGSNGAGKTTLLKVIANVTEPTKGKIRVSGRVAALIDVVVGFHPELTGTENAYLLGAMHGFSRKAMEPFIERIVDFAELPDLVDTPLKRYSAGMITRIAFATVASLEADIMLVDEVLAVGDAQFQQKCARWLDEYRRRGGTLVFVSHNLGLVRNMTERAVWLDHGKIVAQGTTNDVLAEYGRGMEHRDETAPAGVSRDGQLKKLLRARGSNRWGSGGARVQTVHVDQQSDQSDRIQVDIAYERSDLDRAIFRVGLLDEGGHQIGGAISPELRLAGGGGSVSCVIQPLPLRSGIYFPVVSILSADGQVRDHWQLDRPVVVEREDGVASGLGPVTIEGSWTNGGPHGRE
jgi:lipopolysaccharide transport system ATP-binding protein